MVVGALCELCGLIAVAKGITDTRENFGAGPSILQRVWTRIVRVAAKFRKRRNVTVSIQPAHMTVSAGNVRVRTSVGFGDWDDLTPDERIDRLRAGIETLQQNLDRTDDRLDVEEKDRSDADARIDRSVGELDQGLRELVREAATGSLRVETIGVFLVGLGLLLGTLGNLLA